MKDALRWDLKSFSASHFTGTNAKVDFEKEPVQQAGKFHMRLFIISLAPEALFRLIRNLSNANMRQYRRNYYEASPANNRGQRTSKFCPRRKSK